MYDFILVGLISLESILGKNGLHFVVQCTVGKIKEKQYYSNYNGATTVDVSANNQVS